MYSYFVVSQTTIGALWNETYSKGVVLPVNDLNVYSVGDTKRSLSIIIIYDIRGFNITQTRVFCDRLAAQYDAHVVMPDFFRNTVAPANVSAMAEWRDRINNWTRVSNDLHNIASWLRNSYGSNQIGLIGFCWGGLQVVRACSNLSETFFTGISIHGSSLTANEVRPLKQPMLFIAARNDPTLVPNISSVIEQSNFNISQQCEYKTYSNMSHGFVSAGANYSDPANVAAIDDVHLRVRNFLDKIRKNNSVSLATNFYFIFIFFIFSFHLYV
jgi:dienelactone hydrolase